MEYCRPFGAISPYESIWSVLQKFIFSNQCSRADALDAMGRKGSSNLLFLNNFDCLKFASASGISADMVENGDCGAQIYRGLPCKRTLRYCQLCLSHGYHSPIQQILYLKKCPFHRVGLIDRCATCDHPIHADLSSLSKSKPFHCNFCGTPLFKIQSGLPKNSVPLMVGEYVTKGKLLVARNTQLSKTIYLEKNPSFSQDSMWLLWEVLYNNNKNACNFEEIKFQYVPNNINEQKYKEIFNKVDRQLWLHYLADHRSCINKLTHAYWYDGSVHRDHGRYCPVAEAYLNWMNIFKAGLKTNYGSRLLNGCLEFVMDYHFRNEIAVLSGHGSWVVEAGEFITPAIGWILGEVTWNEELEEWRLAAPRININQTAIQTHCKKGNANFDADNKDYPLQMKSLHRKNHPRG